MPNPSPGTLPPPLARTETAIAERAPSRHGWRVVLDYISIARPDHWVKNVFVLPGIVVAISLDPSTVNAGLARNIVLGLIAVCLIASSNYVLNEILDAPSDREHPVKRFRPVPAGRIRVPVAYGEWLALMGVGLTLSALVSWPFAATMFALWVMGCAYNVPPVRTKDVPYLDVVSEAVNNPLRMLAGWYLTLTALVPPISLLLSYWMIGCYFMAIKRYAEYREIGAAAARYRKSFGFYNEQRLLVSIMFYGSHAMLFFGAFIMRYRLELILAFPLVAFVMALYLAIGFKPHSAAQHPELLHREWRLMSAVVACAMLMGVLLFVDIDALYSLFFNSLTVGR
jgi:4-hydroxybenzoate polyprenyltransferase